MNKVLSFLPLPILAAGVLVFLYLKDTKPETKKSSIVSNGAAVEIETIQETSSRVIVKARGTVIPAREVTLGAEVSGKIVYVSETLQPGGTFKKGELIARIDASDYRIAVQQQFANVDSAQAQVAVEESRVAVATREWEMFGGNENANKELALRQPQMRSVKTRLKSAQSGLKRARLGVERTVVRAPFDGMIKARAVDLGQIVGPGSRLLSFVGTEAYWVQVSIPVERLVWLSIPGVAGQTEGSQVTINHRVGNQLISKQGRVLRLLAGVDPAGHMARVLIEVKDPLGLAATEVSSDASALPLLLESYVEVEIQGRNAENIVELDRASLRRGGTVFLLSDDFTLDIQKVEILWRREKSVLISDGLKTGDKVIVSPLSSPVAGMKLRLPGHKQSEASSPKKASDLSSKAAAASKGSAL